MRGPNKNERPSTYFVQSREKKEELTRLTIQGHMLTQAMGGPLPEQVDPTLFHHVLDVACGAGDWALDLARSYPNLSIVGVDISQLMVTYANEQASINGLSERISFQVMDVLATIPFPDESFDLVNLRLGVSFLRTWDWPRLLQELLRITRPGGVLRLTDSCVVGESTSPAVIRFSEMLMNVFFQAGHLFTQESAGLVAHMPGLLTYHGYQQVQTKAYELKFHAGTPAGQAYYEDLLRLNTLRPFFHKWGINTDDFDTVYQQALKEAQQEQFWVIWHFLSAWGNKPSIT